MTDQPEAFDAVLLGAGQANNPLSRSLARAGTPGRPDRKGQDRRHVRQHRLHADQDDGGQRRIAYLTRRASEYGVHTGDVQVRLDEVRHRTQAIVEKFSSGSERQLVSHRGVGTDPRGRIVLGPRTVRVKLNGGGSRVLSGKVVVIDTGCRPARPDIPGLDTVPWLDSTGIMQLGTVPDHLVVLGGGYIGVEFAQMFRRFGSRVTLVQKGGQLLPREDPDMAECARRKSSERTGSMSS